MIQRSFTDVEYSKRHKQRKREKFLERMKQVIPWEELYALIRPHYYKAGQGRQPMPLEVMLRIYFLQQWYSLSDPSAEEHLIDLPTLSLISVNLSDPSAEEHLIDSYSMRQFVGVQIDAIPDETTILKFR